MVCASAQEKLYITIIFVSEFEKRGITAIFITFQPATISSQLGFRLGLIAVWAFYFTDPTLEASPLIPSGDPPKTAIKWRFSTAVETCTHPTHTRSGRGSQFAASVVG